MISEVDIIGHDQFEPWQYNDLAAMLMMDDVCGDTFHGVRVGLR